MKERCIWQNSVLGRTCLVVQWLGDWNPPAILGDAGSTSGLRGFHMLQGSWACVTTTEPQVLSACSRAHKLQLLSPCTLEPVLCNKRSFHNERPLHSNERSPHSLQLEKTHVQPQRPSAAKKKKKKKSVPGKENNK